MQNTKDMIMNPILNILIYGDPKVGKSTFATTTPKPLIADAESGYRYMGSKGIEIPVASIETWDDITEFYKEAMKPEYETIVIDPVNELLEKLMKKAKQNRLYVQSTDPDALSMKGWGYVKGKMKEMLKGFRDINKNVIFVAHTKTEEKNGTNKIGPKLDANLAQDFMAMMDIIGYMSMFNANGKIDRYISFEPNINYEAGARPKGLPAYFLASKGFGELYKTVCEDKIFKQYKKDEADIKSNDDKFFEGMLEELNPASVPEDKA